MLGHALDAATTHYHVSDVGVSGEANPLMRVVFERTGPVGIWAVKAAALSWLYLTCDGLNDADREAEYVEFALFGWVAAVNNVAVIHADG